MADEKPPMEAQPVAGELEPAPAPDDEAYAETWSSPLPIPEHIAQYEAVLPGSFERMLSLWERQTAHDQSLEQQDLEHEHEMDTRTVELYKRGQWFALTSILVIMGVACLAIVKGYPWLSGLFGVSGLAAIVSMFLLREKETSESDS